LDTGAARGRVRAGRRRRPGGAGVERPARPVRPRRRPAGARRRGAIAVSP